MFLDQILTARAQRRPSSPEREEWRSRAADGPAPRDFGGALRNGPSPRIIAEIKRASPSKGPLRPDLLPADLARAYQAGGAAALSVLTEPDFFQGSSEDLRAARAACTLPVIRKDFLLEPWEVYQARAWGADAVLLIAAILEDGALRDLQGLAWELGMEALVEVHTEEELERVLPAQPRLVGINNRDLRSFQVSLEMTRMLAPRIARPALRVSESGFFTGDQLVEFPEIDAFLIGESLVKADDPRAALQRLRGEAQGG